MKKKIPFIIMVIAFFLVFYSGYYYYSLNTADRPVVIDDTADSPALVFGMDALPAENETQIAFPACDTLDAVSSDWQDRQRMPENPWNRFVLSNNERAWESKQQSIRSGLSLNLPEYDAFNCANDSVYLNLFSSINRFSNDFYVMNENQLFNETPIGFLVSRPGHRTVKPRLYVEGEQKAAILSIPGEEYEVIFFRTPDILSPADAYSAFIRLTEKNRGRALQQGQKLAFPIIFWTFPWQNHPCASMAEGASCSRFQGQFTLSSRLNDVSLLPSRRFASTSREESPAPPMMFDEPFYLFVSPAGGLPFMASYVGDPKALQYAR